jgi:hypothetical protein
MQRRTALKYLFVLTAGSVVVPACLHKRNKVSIALKHLDISTEQEKVLGEIAETVIPGGTTPGAKDTYAHLFVLRMIDDCYEEKNQKIFLSGLNDTQHLAAKKFGASFLKCNIQQRNEIIGLLETKNASGNAVEFYAMMKALTIQGYLTSRPVLGDIFKYELVPGRYNGFFPVKTIIHQS